MGGIGIDAGGDSSAQSGAHERLVRDLRRAAATSVIGSAVRLSLDEELPYGERAVRWYDMITFAAAMKKNGTVVSYSEHHPHLDIDISASGRVTLLGIPAINIGKVSAPAVGSPASSSNASVSHQSDVSATAKGLFTPAPPPIASVLSLIVRELNGKVLGYHELGAVVASGLGYPPAHAKTDGAPTGEPSYQRTFASALTKLVNEKLVERRGKLLHLGYGVASRVKSGQLKLPVMEEPKVKAPKPPKPQVSPTAPKANNKRELAVARVCGQPRVPGNLETMSMPDLLILWKNALRIIGDPKQKTSHASAQAAVIKVTKEWERRGSSTTNAKGFKWPTTVANGGNGRLGLEKSQAEGMLSYLEYRVGHTHGEPTQVRQAILRRVFEATLPPVFDSAYMLEWGPNGSYVRLQKMAVSIAAFCRNSKRRKDGSREDAIREWEQDLDFLHRHFYVGHFHFGFAWPTSKI